MSEFVIPPWIIPDEEDIELIDDNTISFEPALGRGSSQRQSFGAPRYRITRKHTVRSSEEANLASTLAACSGKFISIRSAINKTLRGALAASELLSNNQFADGTTGWTVSNSSIHRVADRVSSLIIGGAQTGSAAVVYGIYRSATTVQYAPYVSRAAIVGSREVANSFVLVGSTAGASDYASGSGAVPSLVSATGCSNSTTTHYLVGAQTITGSKYEYYLLCNYTSMSRCAVVDNGGNNLLQSDNFASTWTQTNVTVGTDVIAGPILGGLADGVLETVTNAQHRVTQAYAVTSAAFDITHTAYVKAGLRNFVFIRLDDGAGNGVRVSFNLTTGAQVTLSAFGSGVIGQRAFSQDVGNGWFLVSLVVRKTTSATSMTAAFECTTDGSTLTYAGSTASPSFYAVISTSTLSSFPSRPTSSTGSQVAAASQTGSQLYIKGLPASTTGLALPGDFIEINGELKRLTAALDSDGLGLGLLQFKPEIVRSPADNDPVIFFQPFGRFVVSNVKTRRRVADVELTYDLEQIYE